LSLKEKLDEAYKDFELLSLDWDRVDTMLKAKSGGELESLRSQAALATRLKEKMKVLKDQNVTTSDRMRTIASQLEEKEKELIFIRERMGEYEAGVYGLKDAARELKQIKLEKSLRDREIASLTKQINQYESQLSDVVDENEELRERLGVESSHDIDTSKVKVGRAVELVCALAIL
jgi:chromosome segregation ATPase